jgi:ribosomal protein L11 methyltransferase
MKWIETKVTFEAPEPRLATDLISEIFYQFGLQGVVVQDPELQPEEGWADPPPPRATQWAVIGYLPKNDDAPARFQVLESQIHRLQRDEAITCTTACLEIDEQDWAESWKAFFWPEKIGETIVVKPTWREYRARAGEIVIELDPGMAFGTGTHPTTAMCIELLEHYLKPGDRLLDVGTGSGILMAAGALLGASQLVGIDSDTLAVEVARKNLALNRIDPTCYRVVPGHLVSDIRETFHLVAANILSEVIVALLDDLPPRLCDNGLFLASGIIADNRDKVIGKMAAVGLDPIEVRERETWVAIAARKRP